YDALVRLLRPRPGAARFARPRLRGGPTRRRRGLPRPPPRAHRGLDRAADPDRRPPDRRLHRALAARPRGPAGRPARGVASGRRVASRRAAQPLAAGAKPRSAHRDADLVYLRPAPLAGLAGATVDLEAVLRAAARSIRQLVVAQCRTL